MKRVMFLSLGLLLLATGCGQSDDASSQSVKQYNGQPDACAVFTQQQVTDYVGIPVQNGHPTGTGSGCTYQQVGNGASPAVLSLNIDIKDDHAKFGDARNIATKTARVNDIAGIGDEAFGYATNGLESAEARVGTKRIRILVQQPAHLDGESTAVLRDAVARLTSGNRHSTSC